MSARTVMIAKIHVAKRDLALSEESYRDVLQRMTKLDSTSRMSERQLDRVLQEFGRLGFRPSRSRTGAAKDPQIRMIHAVFADLVEIGAIGAEDPAAALRAFVQRQTRTKANPAGITDPRFLRPGPDTNRVLEGLKAWLAREQRKRAA